MTKLQKMTAIGILAAISMILYFFKVPLPFFPVFLTLDVSDVPALIGAITMGPVAGVMVQFLKNGIEYLSHGSYVGLPINQIANFLSGALIVGLIGFFYHYQKKLDWKSFALSITVFLTAMFFLNYYFILPTIMNLLGLNMDQYLTSFTEANPFVTDFRTAVLLVIIPFNLIKISFVYAVGLPFSFKLQRILQKRRLIA
ncbi:MULTISPECIES: ECF transporter S component [Pontibacillus]|uniref:Riboflavin transporter n=1 Tax=Pontibacillus chungwhensis TaxID=265426 RepID=A0ABY8UZQ6_9BACI|nr:MULTISPECIES: ECF transporter S component [Pontibacillus]MCD5324864.1 ECF transporter S component [Pontibacillus sp. HN14]WIF98825.1 ECF transporter S component [Pontibacillus chungwhensis]